MTGGRGNFYDRRGGGYTPGATGMTGATDRKLPDEAYQDPFTHEDVRDDMVAKVVLVVVINATPPAPLPTVPGAPASPAAPKTVAAAGVPAGPQ